MKTIPTSLLCALLLGVSTLAIAQTATSATAAPRAPGNVQVYGILDMYVGRSDNSGAPRATTVVNSGGLSTSFWGLRGTEDLGHGLRAVFALESFVRLDTGDFGRLPGDPLFSRNAYVGLADSWGELRLGRQSAAVWLAAIAFNPFGASTRFSPLQTQLWTPPYGINIAADTGWANTLGYTSPTAHGVTVRAQYGLGEVQSGRNNAAVSATWMSGPAGLVLAAQKVEAGPGITPAAPSQTTWLAGVSYDLKVAKLYATWDRNRSAGTERRTRTGQIGATVPFGRGNLLLSWAHTRDKSRTVAPYHRNSAAIGYDYAISPRTGLYAVALYDKTTVARSGTTWATGIRLRY
ncbi:porin [Massilia arenosa]|uniref:Porin n=1 Tax=Zemynaea arenosa TaxID=2561931 RepID=A0A4Y9SEP0_9BURK|nr:porin [Massilia arenosa]TFW19325.1 porin [Massilia arenosa]